MSKILLIPFFLLVSLVAQAQNMVTNGSFESDFTGWTNLAGDGGAATYTVETQDVQAGSKALKAQVTTLGANSWSIQSMGPVWASVEGTQYTLSFYAKASTAGAKVKAVQQVGSSYAEREFTLTTNWAKYDWTFTAGAPNLQLKFNFSTAATYFLDNISIMPPVQMSNAIANGSFESDFSGWTNLAGDGGAATYTVETQDVQAGSKALKAQVTTLGANSWSIQTMGPVWPSVEGTEYKLSFYAKAAADGARLKAVQQIGSSYAEREFTLTTSWALYEWTFTAGAPNLQLKFNFSNAGTYFIDNVSIMVPASSLSADKAIAAAEKILVYPNPSSNGSFAMELNQFGQGRKLTMQLLNIQGKTVLEQALTTDMVRVEQNLKPGIYFIRLSGADGVVTKKLVVN